MTLPTKIEKREDKLPLERALRALEDVHKSLKEFSKKDSVVENVVLNDEVKTVRQKAKRLLERTTRLAAHWREIFSDKH
jgi:hypothetical protein